jgi:hypothetical protein
MHYGGGAPGDAEDLVREMVIAGVRPDATTGHLLIAIDLGWQQLQNAI